MKILCVGEPEFQPILLRMREQAHCDVVIINRVSSAINEHFPPRMDFNLDKFIKVAEEMSVETYELKRPKQVFPHAVSIKQFAKSQCQKAVTTFRRSR